MEVTVGNNLCIGFIVFVGINISLVGIKLLATYGKCIGIEYLDFAGNNLSLNFVKLFLSSLSRYLVVKTDKLNNIILNAAAEILSDFGAVYLSVNDVFEVRFPVNLGRNECCVRTPISCVEVVSNIRNTCFFTSIQYTGTISYSRFIP